MDLVRQRGLSLARLWILLHVAVVMLCFEQTLEFIQVHVEDLEPLLKLDAERNKLFKASLRLCQKVIWHMFAHLGDLGAHKLLPLQNLRH